MKIDLAVFETKELGLDAERLRAVCPRANLSWVGLYKKQLAYCCKEYLQYLDLAWNLLDFDELDFEPSCRVPSRLLVVSVGSFLSASRVKRCSSSLFWAT